MSKSAVVVNLEKITKDNTYYRNVLYTTSNKNMQLVLMSLLPNEEIGMEMHPDVDQFFRIEQGSGQFIHGKNNKIQEIKENDAIIVTAGTYHNIKNTGSVQMKLYTIYTPSNHPNHLHQKTKSDE
jgi:mannose-6-phosphate isomerase-like protein (cupin superfamily)